MSATEEPVLDPANILHDPKDPLSPPMVDRGRVVDPIAKTIVGFPPVSGYDYPEDVIYSNRIRLNYVPKMELEMFQKQQFDEIGTLALEESVTLAELSLTCTIKNNLVVAKVEPGAFSGIGPGTWNQWWAKHTEEESEYRFWPNDLPGRNTAIATHFLHFLQYIIKGQVKPDHWPRGDNIRDYILAIDAELAAYIGTRQFPVHEQTTNGDFVIFNGNLRNEM